MNDRIKSTLKSIDRNLLNSNLSKLRSSHFKTRYRELGHEERTLLREKCAEISFHYRFGAPTDEATELARLCDLYGSDKGSLGTTERPYDWEAHTYATHYAEIFAARSRDTLAVLEFGIGTNNPSIPSNMGVAGKPGASLRVWRDFFPNAQIYGADIDRKILFKDERIETFFVDQTQPVTFQALWREVGATQFDVIIDDGLHTPTAAKTTFDNAFSRVKPGGLYIIEDLQRHALLEMTEHLVDRSFEIRELPNLDYSDGNNLLIIYG